MYKLELKLVNDPYNNYGILTQNYIEEIEIVGQHFNFSDYNKLYNNCLIDISKLIYKGSIQIRNNILEVTLNPQYIKKMTRNDLQIMQNIGQKINESITYDNLKYYYSSDLFPLPPTENKTNKKSYPTTNYEFFKYEDFYNFNWVVYYRYISDKYKSKFNTDTTEFWLIEQTLYMFTKLIFELKMAFNRLRPSQSSFIENIPIKTYITYSGQTPALPSGHSLQGFLFSALIYYNLKKYFDSLNVIEYEYELYLLVRVCKDAGHRRIMAGLHYPSDMLASWVIFGHILKYLKIDDQVRPYYEMLESELEIR